MRHADITFVILTKNEARNIAQCLASVPAGSQALVYDAMSSDQTVGIARSLGAQVVRSPWQGYVRTRAAAARHVSTPWTFMLDADERLTISLRDELARLEPPADVTAYSVPRRNWFCGKWMRCAGWWPDRLVRLFRTGTAHVSARSDQRDADLHETWRTSGRCAQLTEPIEHYSYRTVTDYWRKFVRYTDLEGRSGRASGLRLAAAWLGAPLRFAWLLFARGGLVEGWRGMVVCLGSAFYPAVSAAKRYVRE
jgi:glycosyltransferase involved in cell wall biosynthesis